jgi:D-alanyl-D-alanine carboxypeptidase/D-alanyl-D-alanine-endopeptidase (penicillin-binding protein 4)
MLVLIIAAAIPALLLLAVARWAGGQADAGDDAVPAVDPAASTTSPPAPASALNTGLLSFRRASSKLSRDLNMAAFQQGVQPLMNAVGDRSCAAISLDGELVGEKNIDNVVIPASNMKILVAAAASDVLGDDYRYTTRVMGPAPTGGVVNGDVYLVGGGDPVLSGDWYPNSDLDRFPPFNTTSLDDLARNLAAAGVTQINGNVIGDGSRYDDEFYAPGWGPDVNGIEAGPYDALLVNDARVQGDDQRAGDPNQAAAREFVRILGEQGIAVTGGPATGTAPAGSAELATVQSQPLSAVIAEMLTNSDNNTAEMMLKEIGLKVSGAGTREAGAAAVSSTLTNWGIDTNGLVVADGSGLSSDDRVSCRTMISVLQHAGFGGPVGQGLAIGG